MGTLRPAGCGLRFKRPGCSGYQEQTCCVQPGAQNCSSRERTVTSRGEIQADLTEEGPLSLGFGIPFFKKHLLDLHVCVLSEVVL